jgi:serine/threonine protein kinase
MDYLVDPQTYHKVKLHSTNGKNILTQYIKNYQIGGARKNKISRQVESKSNRQVESKQGKSKYGESKHGESKTPDETPDILTPMRTYDIRPQSGKLGQSLSKLTFSKLKPPTKLHVSLNKSKKIPLISGPNISRFQKSFGKLFKLEETKREVGATALYAAPEHHYTHLNNLKTDVWSLGLIIIEILMNNQLQFEYKQTTAKFIPTKSELIELKSIIDLNKTKLIKSSLLNKNKNITIPLINLIFKTLIIPIEDRISSNELYKQFADILGKKYKIFEKPNLEDEFKKYTKTNKIINSINEFEKQCNVKNNKAASDISLINIEIENGKVKCDKAEKVTNCGKSKTCVIKKNIPVYDLPQFVTVVNEISIMYYLTFYDISNSYTVQLYKTTTSGDNISHIQILYMEYGAKVLKNEMEHLQTSDINKKLDLIFNLIETVAFLHSANICHYDIKPDNIIITNDGQVKLIDYGISKYILNKKPFLMNIKWDKLVITDDYSIPHEPLSDGDYDDTDIDDDTDTDTDDGDTDTDDDDMFQSS